MKVELRNSITQVKTHGKLTRRMDQKEDRLEDSKGTRLSNQKICKKLKTHERVCKNFAMKTGMLLFRRSVTWAVST